MNEKRGGSFRWQLLAIPAMVMVAKSIHRRHRWAEAGGPAGPGMGRHGHRGWAFGSEGSETTGEFRLPPRLQAILSAWHDQAHKATGAGERSSAAAPAGSGDPGESPAA